MSSKSFYSNLIYKTVFTFLKNIKPFKIRWQLKLNCFIRGSKTRPMEKSLKTVLAEESVS